MLVEIYTLLPALTALTNIKAISRIPIPWRQILDKLLWTKDHKDMFLVKSAYSASQAHGWNSNTSNLPWQKLWKIKFHERVKMLLWRIGANILPTEDNVRFMLGIGETWCVFVRKLCNLPTLVF